MQPSQLTRTRAYLPTASSTATGARCASTQSRGPRLGVSRGGRHGALVLLRERRQLPGRVQRHPGCRPEHAGRAPVQPLARVRPSRRPPSWENANGPPRPGDDTRARGTTPATTTSTRATRWTRASPRSGRAFEPRHRRRRQLDYHWNDPTPKRGFGLPIEANFAAGTRSGATPRCGSGAGGGGPRIRGPPPRHRGRGRRGRAFGRRGLRQRGTQFTPHDTVTWDIKSLTSLIAAQKRGPSSRSTLRSPARCPPTSRRSAGIRAAAVCRSSTSSS